MQLAIQLTVNKLKCPEDGYGFYIPELDSTKLLHFFTYISTNDKSAQYKMENLKPFMAAYGCGLCYTPGLLFKCNQAPKNRVVTAQKKKESEKTKKKTVALRVYPFDSAADLRSNVSHDYHIKKMSDETLSDSHGHLGFSEFRNLKEFDIAQSFLIDDLHAVYEDVMRGVENYTKQIQSNTEKILKKKKDSSFEEQLPVFDGEEIMWLEDGEVWFYLEIKQQRQQFIRSKPSHSHDSARHKRMMTAGSEQHEITQLTITNHNHEENQRELEHKLLNYKPNLKSSLGGS
ncbi:unnamed protein product [Didymodactylos carnosus]|uniref:Uncharacterized protein n=1 Tax=Didymodactylos carnosus TaxID=1234261 RepID=A0A8S2EVP1_9BILA|nr:unnamed protein product [Didymodactylos carnosus]CAF4060302.1 unnamed protein product [Didymodactylos carnosus]